MWSLVQYRQIRRDVEQDWQHKKSDNPEDTGVRQQPEHVPSGEPDYQHRDKDTGKVMVGKEGHDDPIDPHNWSLRYRNGNIAVLSLLIFAQGWAGGADSMANTDISEALHVSKVAENLSTAMYLWGIGCGCLFVGPLSETVGRNPTFLTATFVYLFFVLGAALTPTFGGQIVCRVFVGLFASATLGINGASVGDQYRPVKRAFVFPIIAWANIAAPMIAPIAGGWITSTPSLGWRWCEWITLIISAFAFVVALICLPETYLPILIDWKARHLRSVSGSDDYVSKHAETASFWGRLKQVLPMPVTFFTSEPVIAVFGGYLTLLYILQYSFLSGFDYTFKETYSLSTGMTGSCFGSIAAGSTTFMLCAPLLYRFSRHQTGDVAEAAVAPEFRLWPAMLTAPLLPVSLFWLGWTNYVSISIWSGLGACFVFGIVATAMYVSCYEYIIDAYGEHAAVALASITMVRYLISGGMVMAARPMYEGIGVHWTMTWLGCVAALLAPAPVVFWKYGAKLREKSPYAS
ncbi:major facilitator superfamily domain-containing protein [Exophiala viscosa]|uniref:major facilitator superfamily domain-containing protein n=1 Tax=Exophiala viscosa TaxID=2486360 RepID=UPI00218ED06A|nr:major facilitator superfamily domain-containing protein [Exophiala viscosa]